MKSLLGKLEEKNKIVLDKIYLQGYTQSEVAKELDIPLGTVKSRVKIALNILRDQLHEEKRYFLGVFIIIILITLLILMP